MTRKAEAKTASKTTEQLEADIPTMLCAADVEAGCKRVNEARAAISPVEKAIELAETQMLMVRVCDMVEGCADLESVSVSVDMESDDEGGSYPSLGVSCEYAEAEDGAEVGECVEDGLQDQLSDVARELYGEDITDAALSPKAFVKQLSQALMGEAAGPAWLAAREAAAIAAVVPETAKRSRSMRA